MEPLAMILLVSGHTHTSSDKARVTPETREV